MAESTHPSAPWLLAVWPGIGNVAIDAGAYLVQALGAEPIAELPTRDYFEVDHVDIDSGLIRVPDPPRHQLFGYRTAGQGPWDLLIMLGSAQPARGGYELCREVVRRGAAEGARRCISFAALAGQMDPSRDPRVFAVATSAGILAPFRDFGVEALSTGQIGGLNGLLLASAVAEGMDGICLLGEMPYFAVAIPNPQTSLAVLQVFTAATGLTPDLSLLSEEAAKMRKRLQELVQTDEEASAKVGSGELVGDSARLAFDEQARLQVEALFDIVRQDRCRATDLKRLLDHHGVYHRYEDRFLDLFRKAE